MARHFRGARLPATTHLQRTEDQIHDALLTLPRYRILLHQNRAHDAGYVERALCVSIPVLLGARARQVSRDAQRRGRVEVIVCPREPAEYYYQRLREWRLACSMELA